MYLNFDSSRIEGLFGLFKGNYGHDRGKITTVINSLNNLCGVLKTQSFSTYSKTYKQFCSFHIIPPDQFKFCGRMLLEFLQDEYNAMIVGKLDGPCVWCNLREQQNDLCIPCRHTIRYGFKLDIKLIHSRYLRSDSNSKPIPNVVRTDETNNPLVKNRKNFLSPLDQFLNYYGRNEVVDQILENTLNDFEKVKIFPTKGMPPTISQAGHAFNHPSHNVFAGRQKTKRNYTCSTCHQKGHNSQNCPFNLYKNIKFNVLINYNFF